MTVGSRRVSPSAKTGSASAGVDQLDRTDVSNRVAVATRRAACGVNSMVVVAQETAAHVEVGDEFASTCWLTSDEVAASTPMSRVATSVTTTSRLLGTRSSVSRQPLVKGTGEARGGGSARTVAVSRNLRTRACDSSSGVVADTGKLYANRSSSSCKAGLSPPMSGRHGRGEERLGRVSGPGIIRQCVATHRYSADTTGIRAHRAGRYLRADRADRRARSQDAARRPGSVLNSASNAASPAVRKSRTTAWY
jgi:hypothetical protein